MEQSEYKELTFAILIMRHGGLDGVALQKYEYSKLLNRLDVKTHVISGREEKEFRDEARPDWQKQTELEALYWRHGDVLTLYANSFREGPETQLAASISEGAWLELFNRSRSEIEVRIESVLDSIPNNTPVIVYNFLALRHIHPAAAVAIRNVIERSPHRGFISHAADPDAERPEKIARLKEFVKSEISANGRDEPYSGGPYRMNNLYHIVLNPTQRSNFLEKYQVDAKHVFEIPDFLDFSVVESRRLRQPSAEFFQDASHRFVVPDSAKKYRYTEGEFSEGDVVVVSPVRPVYRKRLLEAMIATDFYRRSRGVRVVFLVTHPDIDDPDYFKRTVDFAAELELPYIHYGQEFRVETLEWVYANLAAMPSVGVVSSSAGGWENALNEMAAERVPFVMNHRLNSFKPLTEVIGIQTFGMDFEELSPFVDNGAWKNLETSSLSALAEWIDGALDATRRRELVESNYRQAYKWLSHEATAPRFMEALLRIYARHGLPGSPGDSCEE